MKQLVVNSIVAIGLVAIAVHGADAEASRESRGAAACEVAADMTPTHVRAVDESVAALLRAGIRRSPTVADIVRRIEASSGIVYVVAGGYRQLGRGVELRGGMSHAITVVGGIRIIRVGVNVHAGDLSIATVGHELWHATEVLDDPDATDETGIQSLYERIGFMARIGIYETDGARNVTERVLRELKRCQ